MPIIKLYGYKTTDIEGIEKCRKIVEAVSKKFNPGDAGIVFINSECRTCDEKPSQYRYIEILFMEKADCDKIIAALKEIKIGLDLILIQLPINGYIPEDEMK